MFCFFLKTGEIQESDEMRPKWFAIDEIPFKEMWIDDQYWFPLFLRGDHFHGYFFFENEKQIVYQYLASIDKDKQIEPIYEEIK